MLSRLYFQFKILLAVSGTRVQKTLSRVTYTTLHASLSGTFLTPLKGHSLFPRCCPPTLSAPSERFEDCTSNTASKHACKHEARPPRVKKTTKTFCLDSFDSRLKSYNLSCLLRTHCHLITNEKLSTDIFRRPSA